MMILHRQWMDGHGHPWLWLLASTALVLLWGGAIWGAIGLLRRGNGSAAAPRAADGGVSDPLASAERILAERLARGEIEADEYRARLEALRPGSGESA